MKKLRRGAALFAVLVFMLTALVPTAFAGEAKAPPTPSTPVDWTVQSGVTWKPYTNGSVTYYGLVPAVDETGTRVATTITIGEGATDVTATAPDSKVQIEGIKLDDAKTGIVIDSNVPIGVYELTFEPATGGTGPTTSRATRDIAPVILVIQGTVTLTPNPSPFTLTLSSDQTSVTGTLTAAFAGGDLPSEATWQWASNNSAIALVSTPTTAIATVTAVAKGTTNITVYPVLTVPDSQGGGDNSGGGNDIARTVAAGAYQLAEVATCAVTVDDGTPTVTPTLKDVNAWTSTAGRYISSTDQTYPSYWAILPTAAAPAPTIDTGASTDAELTVIDSVGANVSSIALKDGIVTIGANTPLGVYALTIADGSKTVETTVVVQGTVSITPASIKVAKSGTENLTATLQNAAGQSANVSLTWSWASSAEATATVSAASVTGTATVKAVATGTASITATPTVSVGSPAVSYPLAAAASATVTVTEPQLDAPNSWSSNKELTVGTSSTTGDTYASFVSDNSITTIKIDTPAAGTTMSIASINGTTTASSPLSGQFSLDQNTAVLTISANIPVGVYSLIINVNSSSSGGSTRDVTQSTVTLVALGTPRISGTVSSYQPGATVTLTASVSNVDTAQANDVQWQWSVTPNDMVSSTSTSNNTATFTFVISRSATTGTELNVQATPTINGIQIGDPTSAEETVKIGDVDLGIQIFRLADVQTLVTDASLPADGHQYQFVVNTAREQGTDWTYAWSVDTPAGITNTGTAPALTQTSNSSNTALCFPTGGNVGQWTVSVKIEGTDAPNLPSRTIHIEAASSSGASITAYTPVDLEQWIGENVPSTFSISSSTGGTNEQGAAVPYTIVWYGVLNENSSQYLNTGASVSVTPFPTGTKNGTYTLKAAAIPNTMLTNGAISTNDFNKYVNDKPGAAVIWKIRESNPMPTFVGGNALKVTPYNGTTRDANSATSTPQTATLQLGGSATLSKSLAARNKPSTLFTFNWQTAASGSDTWTTVSSTTGFAGFGGEQFTTPLMTLDMDGRKYRLQVTNAQDPTQTITSEEVVLAVNASELISPSTTISIASTMPRYTDTESGYSVTVPQGQSVTMTTQAQLPPGVQATYQWWRAEAPETGQQPNWQSISGATNAQYVLTSAAESDNGDLFRCGMSVNYANQPTTYTAQQVVLNVTSATSFVTVNSITANGEATDLAVYSPSEELELEVQATATGETLEYQWYYATGQNLVSSGNPVSENGNAARYVVTNLAPDTTYYYWCDVNGVLSNTIEVVYPRGSTTPQFIEQPPSEINAAPNSQVTVSVEAAVASRDPLHYQWEVQYPGASAWTVLDVPDQPTLTIRAEYNLNGAQYRCTATNTSVAPATTTGPSDICTLYVFSPDTYVTITSPQDYVVPEPLLRNQGVQATVQVGATQDLSKYQYQWEYSATQDGTYTQLTTPGVETMPTLSLADLGATLNSGSQTFSVQVPLYLLDSEDRQKDEDGDYPNFLPNCYYYQNPGYYRLRITNTTVSNSGVSPTNLSTPTYILIEENGQPYVSEQPQNQVVAQGSSATFTVNARLNTGTPVYRWQKWVYTAPNPGMFPDYAYGAAAPTTGLTGYWANCVETDGTGINTASFTTAPTTAEDRLASMQNQPIYYRCLVYSYNSGLMAYSDAALLTVTAAAPVTPALVPVDGTNLAIVTSGTTKYLQGTGLEATTNGTTAQELLDDMQPFRNYTIRIMSGTGSSAVVVQPTSRVCTGFVMELLNRDSTVVDSATIVVKGDVLGRGCMQLSQLVTMANVYKGSQTLTGAFLMAGKLISPSTTNGITLSDLVAEAQMFRKYPPLVQS